MKLRSLAILALAACTFAHGQKPATPTPAPAVQTTANPALWKVQGAKGTVYLFGTVHVMKKDVVWETAKVKAAFKASDTLYLEIADIDEESMKAAQPTILGMGIDADHPLSTRISKEDVALLDGVAKDLGAPGEAAFEPMKPWLVYLTLSVLPAVKAGYDPNSGIDRVLGAEAKTDKKNMKGFETIDQQVHFFADFPVEDQVVMLHEVLIDLPKSVKQMDEVVADWTHGEVDKIAAMENDEMKVKHPALYDKLLVKRNEHFADALSTLLKDPATGTLFVAIGAAHLAGPDSVIKMLETKGFKVTREE